MRSPLLDLPGAVPADGPDADVAAHYGDLFAEQRVLVKGEAVVDRSNREVIRIAGADRLKWLNDLTSQKLDALAPGEWTQTLLLDAQGRLEHHLTLVDDGAAVLAHVEPGASATLIDYLDRMRFMLRVEVSLVEDLAVLSSATEDYLVPRAELPDHLGRPLAGLWAYEALRIEEHRPRAGFDTDHKTIPHEVGWIGPAVHLNKGCYRGQETVARVHNVGHPPRRLVFLHLDGSVDTLPPHGAPVIFESQEVGTVGSAARHYELGPIALALVKRTVPVDATLLAGGVAAAQEVIVPPDAGRNVTIDPALRRRIR
ncbi:folate-binding protein [Nonomuraea glycinis]|uniref:Folate-binding protein n=1 Tax=Nonomuraea glycinis TaxID=2047744 RepID=A0A918AAD6_9ACTN|nr:folate-binding protein YgfZ [Nonomuraea glycinis]MCA2180112.1 folate-binding protein [Nonomuraea glycinis]WSG71335.1 folate-binding protein YgfZ [Nonomuraea glycinis]GGP10904.1 folate-binding protein [Nonomuraea glycinis]